MNSVDFVMVHDNAEYVRKHFASNKQTFASKEQADHMWKSANR